MWPAWVIHMTCTQSLCDNRYCKQHLRKTRADMRTIYGRTVSERELHVGRFQSWTSILAVFDAPRHCYSVMVFFMQQWHMAWTRRPDIVLSRVSANFLISSESCELGKIFNGRWSKKRYAKNYTVWSFIICTAHRTLLAKTMEDEKKGKWKICGRREHKFFCSGKHEGRRQLWKN